MAQALENTRRAGKDIKDITCRVSGLTSLGSMTDAGVETGSHSSSPLPPGAVCTDRPGTPGTSRGQHCLDRARHPPTACHGQANSSLTHIFQSKLPSPADAQGPPALKLEGGGVQRAQEEGAWATPGAQGQCEKFTQAQDPPSYLEQTFRKFTFVDHFGMSLSVPTARCRRQNCCL